VRVTDAEAGQRVDNFLIRRAPGVPKSHLYQLIRKGKVLVDGRRVKAQRKLSNGEQVRIPALQVTRGNDVKVPDAMGRKLQEAIIVEEDDFLLINKPAGIAVHGGSGIAYGVIDALRQSLEQPKLELVHRLDRATSGCLLIARDLRRGRALQELFRQRQIEKRYLALVEGAWPASLKRVDVALKKNAEHAGERRVVVSTDGQAAVTHFSIAERFAQSSLLDVSLETGRTHQIRVHALYAGHALIGDTRYGKNSVNQRFRQAGLDRLFLHAHRLCFEWDGKRFDLEAATDSHWQKGIERLRQDSRQAMRVSEGINEGIDKRVNKSAKKNFNKRIGKPQ